MMYEPQYFKVSPPDQPDKEVKIEAFNGKRGASLKGKSLLVHQRIINREVRPDSLIVRESL